MVTEISCALFIKKRVVFSHLVKFKNRYLIKFLSRIFMTEKMIKKYFKSASN